MCDPPRPLSCAGVLLLVSRAPCGQGLYSLVPAKPAHAHAGRLLACLLDTRRPARNISPFQAYYRLHGLQQQTTPRRREGLLSQPFIFLFLSCYWVALIIGLCISQLLHREAAEPLFFPPSWSWSLVYSTPTASSTSRFRKSISSISITNDSPHHASLVPRPFLFRRS